MNPPVRSWSHAVLNSRPAMVIVLVTAILGATTLGIAGAASTGLISACVHKSTGAVRIITPASAPSRDGNDERGDDRSLNACTKNETLLTWSIQGNQGPQGAAGSTGATGSSGPAGATGATGPIGGSGPAGSSGAVGVAGAVGASGPAGATGAGGPAGPAGAKGDPGPAGTLVGSPCTTSDGRAGTIAMTLDITNVYTVGCTPPDSSLVLSPSSHDFGTAGIVPLRATTPYVSFVFTITNTGTAPSVHFRIDNYPANDFHFGGSTCGTQTGLAPGASCTAEMRFAPVLLGLRSDSLTLRTGAGVVLAQAGMTGTGVPLDATLTISPTSHDFGTLPVGSATVSQVFTVTNTGTTASAALATAGSAQTPGGPSLSFDSYTTATALGFGLVADSCRLTTSLVPLASCTVTVTYTPTAVGLVSGSLLVFAVGNQGVQVTASFGANAVP